MLEARDKLHRIVTALDPDLSFHDFRMVSGENRLILSLIWWFPREYDEEASDRVLHQVMSLMKEIDERYACVITVDEVYLRKRVGIKKNKKNLKKA